MPEQVILEAIAYGHEVVKEIVDFIEDYREEALSMGLAKEKIQIEVPLPDQP